MRSFPRILTMCLITLLAPLAGCSPARDAASIQIGVRTANDHVPFYIADKQKRYAAHGLQVTVHLLPSNTEIIEALQRGDLQVGAVPVTTAIAAISQGSPLHIVAMTGRGSDALLVRSKDGIADVAGLRGKKVATIRASILDVLLQQALREAGLDPARDVELVYMTQLGDMLSALKTGQVDACSNTEPFLTDAERQGWGHVLQRYTERWPDHPCCVVLARDEWAKRNPQALRAILSVHRDSCEWANANLDETADIIVQYLGAFDPALVRASLDPARMRIDYRLTPEEILRMANLMAEQGLIDAPPSAERLVDEQHLQEVLRRSP
jgi:NitT/TauT family transport system substrate-binding protein